jgi:TRAP-type C4-dicarboxylate transport system permease small subunit
MRILAIALVAAGILALIYGGFSYTKETHDAKIGPVEINVQEKERVQVPAWGGVALVVVGTGLLLAGSKKK